MPAVTSPASATPASPTPAASTNQASATPASPTPSGFDQSGLGDTGFSESERLRPIRPRRHRLQRIRAASTNQASATPASANPSGFDQSGLGDTGFSESGGFDQTGLGDTGFSESGGFDQTGLSDTGFSESGGFDQSASATPASASRRLRPIRRQRHRGWGMDGRLNRYELGCGGHRRTRTADICRPYRSITSDVTVELPVDAATSAIVHGVGYADDNGTRYLVSVVAAWATAVAVPATAAWRHRRGPGDDVVDGPVHVGHRRRPHRRILVPRHLTKSAPTQGRRGCDILLRHRSGRVDALDADAAGTPEDVELAGGPGHDRRDVDGGGDLDRIATTVMSLASSTTGNTKTCPLQ